MPLMHQALRHVMPRGCHGTAAIGRVFCWDNALPRNWKWTKAEETSGSHFFFANLLLKEKAHFLDELAQQLERHLVSLTKADKARFEKHASHFQLARVLMEAVLPGGNT